MPTFDSAWDDLTAISDLTVTKFNDIINDLQTWLVALDDDFFATAALDSDVIDGDAMTTGDPSAGASEQVLSRETRITGKLTEQGNTQWTLTQFDNDATPDVSGVRAVLSRASGGALTITKFENGTEGQVLMVVRYDGANDITFDHDASAGGIGGAEGEIFLQSGANDTYSGGANPEVTFFLYTDLNGQLANAVWLELSTSAAY